ncbi:hypothetical protein B7494_g1657 [Chlorociboria aeruginascens]|nr:hypothetical protein B7494_g1657 [Chlorociboria aeruginascens]
MYAPSYGYGAANTSSPFNGGALPPQQAPIPQPGPQHMMYNPQQYGPAQHQSPYGAPGPGMGGNAAGMGMMQNSGLAHLAGGHVPAYQTPYTSSPYGSNIPSSSPVHVPNFMPPSNGPAFQMNPNMIPHQQQHRMQPHPSASTPTPTSTGPRASPFGNAPHGTPPTSSVQQFATPQNPNSMLNQGNQGLTPQTPSFPPGAQNNTSSNMATPLSPGSEAREKERVSLLLEINGQLLLECMRCQTAQAEAKKEEASNAEGSNAGENEKEKEEREKDKKDYVECMRRLQANLAYLAAIADRSHKPQNQIPSHPAIMNAPPLHSTPPSKSTSPPKSASKPSSPSGITKEEPSDSKAEGEEKRLEVLRDLYKKLQTLFPGVNPNQMARGQPNMQAQLQKQQHQQNGNAADGSGNTGMGISGDQQKLQNELTRQRMMQEAQKAAQQQQQQQQQIGQS